MLYVPRWIAHGFRVITDHAEVLYKMVQDDSQLAPIYLSVFYDYRGRKNYDVPLQILNPQSKIGKMMYEAFHARTLELLDYETFCFAVASTIGRSTPSVRHRALLIIDVEDSLNSFNNPILCPVDIFPLT